LGIRPATLSDRSDGSG